MKIYFLKNFLKISRNTIKRINYNLKKNILLNSNIKLISIF